jgi:hypothetical protein
MQIRKIYQVQHWWNGQWDRTQNWRKVEASTAKEAAEKVCGRVLSEAGRHSQLRARVLKLGDLRQPSAMEFYAVD